MKKIQNIGRLTAWFIFLVLFGIPTILLVKNEKQKTKNRIEEYMSKIAEVDSANKDSNLVHLETLLEEISEALRQGMVDSSDLGKDKSDTPYGESWVKAYKVQLARLRAIQDLRWLEEKAEQAIKTGPLDAETKETAQTKGSQILKTNALLQSFILRYRCMEKYSPLQVTKYDILVLEAKIRGDEHVPALPKATAVPTIDSKKVRGSIGGSGASSSRKLDKRKSTKKK